MNQPHRFEDSLAIQTAPAHHCSPPAPEQEVRIGHATVGNRLSHHSDSDGQPRTRQKDDVVDITTTTVGNLDDQTGDGFLQSSVVPWPLPSDTHTGTSATQTDTRTKTQTSAYSKSQSRLCAIKSADEEYTLAKHFGKKHSLEGSLLTKDQALQEEERQLLAKICQMTGDSSPDPGPRGKKLLIPNLQDIDPDISEPKSQSESKADPGNGIFLKTADERHNSIGSFFTDVKEISLADAGEVVTSEPSEAKAVRADMERLKQEVKEKV